MERPKERISDRETFEAYTDEQLIEFIEVCGQHVTEYERLMDIAGRVLDSRGIDLESEIKKREN